MRNKNLVRRINHDYTKKEQKFTIRGINHEGTKICGMEQIKIVYGKKI
jgi:hypothetical protein